MILLTASVLLAFAPQIVPQVQRREIEKEAELHAVEKQAYDRLYEGAPGGFTR